MTPTFKKTKGKSLGNHRLASLTLISEKIKEQITLETISKHMKKKTMRGRSQHDL